MVLPYRDNVSKEKSNLRKKRQTRATAVEASAHVAVPALQPDGREAFCYSNGGKAKRARYLSRYRLVPSSPRLFLPRCVHAPNQPVV